MKIADFQTKQTDVDNHAEEQESPLFVKMHNGKMSFYRGNYFSSQNDVTKALDKFFETELLELEHTYKQEASAKPKPKSQDHDVQGTNAPEKSEGDSSTTSVDSQLAPKVIVFNIKYIPPLI